MAQTYFLKGYVHNSSIYLKSNKQYVIYGRRAVYRHIYLYQTQNNSCILGKREDKGTRVELQQYL